MRLTVTVAVATAALSIPMTAHATECNCVKFGVIQYDSPGRDTGSNASLNAEWVTIKNTTSRARTMTGWTLRDSEGNVYRFPSFTLRAGRSVRVHTGDGRRDGNDLYWGQESYVWNNSGDTAILRNRGGTRIDRCSWGDGDGTKAC